MTEAAITWPVARLTHALETLALTELELAAAPLTFSRRRNRDAGDRVELLSRRLKFEADTTPVTYDEVERVLQTAGPAVICLSPDGKGDFLVLIGCSGRYVRLLGPDKKPRRVPLESAANWMRQRLEETVEEEIRGLLDGMALTPEKRAHARRALMSTRLGHQVAGRCWMLHPASAASFWRQLRHARLGGRLALFLATYAATVLASVGSWWLIGAAALEGRFNGGTLLAWTFLLLSAIPLALVAMWSQGVFMLGVGGTLKQRLLNGAMKLDSDALREQGAGHHLARVIESEAVEQLALTGSFYAFAAAVDFSIALVVLVLADQWLLLVALLVWSALLACGIYAYVTLRERWTSVRLLLTHDLVERMVGHRTRLVQEHPATRHQAEDQDHEQYANVSARMDRVSALLVGAPRFWLACGIIALLPQFLAGSATSGLAIGLGVVLLTHGAVTKLISSLSMLCDAGVAYRGVRPLLDALATPERSGQGHPTVAAGTREPGHPGPLISAQDLTYRFPKRAEPVLNHCSLRIFAGDRIHLTGPSGGGKSTLTSLLAGLRQPDAGLLLLDGLDQPTCGDRGWRRRIAAAPQFQENHLFSDTLAFNLLLGRRWPASQEDLAWADHVCRSLGLGDLLDRMPAGIFQSVGEGGWQLSHGERSRIYVARALLQGADLVILDESFTELDPESLLRCVPQAARLSRSLMVVAHA